MNTRLFGYGGLQGNEHAASSVGITEFKDRRRPRLVLSVQAHGSRRHMKL